MADIRRGRAARAAKLASLPAGIAGRAALGVGKRIAGKSKDEVNAELVEKAAEQLFQVLGELKGAAMKLGQALSVMEAAIPPEFAGPYREALTKLQSDAPPLPADKVHRVLDAQLGTRWRDRFQSFEDTPVASASIGQVHSAVWGDGRRVAVKVQYPGADEAVRSDLKTMQRLASLFKQVVPGADVKSIIDELIERTEEELDYRIEATNQRAFVKAFSGDPEFYVPPVVASSPKVVITEWMQGRKLSDVIANGSEEERNNCAHLLLEFTISSPYRCGLLHADTHPGNFMLLDDGRFGVMDFGAVATHEGGLPAATGPILRLARDEKWEELTAQLRTEGFVPPGAKVSHAEIDSYLKPYIEPLNYDRFHFSRKWLQGIAAASTDFRSEQFAESFKTGRQLNLPPNYVMLFRVLGGLVGIAAQLDATVDYAAIVDKWVPGFHEDATTPAQ
ncbi:AarF/ABC1/UbiB kinase family protein [Mycobacterium sp. CBMA271]|uniref:ABC1 kinase family protein n=1 Tax=unclassified Mycobacteroides TaxID=2618759 RepID=UPI0012DCECC6|nr:MULTISPECIES: AarF/UbiB family protein [unclassified Mycobacteroides]MUM17931.1 ABC transporter ATP-binding protein [Mycobacteroides sp. CBMA 326]MUM20500.1 AarF/ABC1/UbiB kinase family protein [Mycobacteroides sp. CBMA 271]